MKKYALAALILTALLLAACAPQAAPTSAPLASSANQAAPMDKAYQESASADSASPSGSGQGGASAEVKRIVIMDASLEIVVADPAGSMDTITRMANDMGGFVVSSNLYKTRTDQGMEVPEAKVTVRVPAEKLNEAMANIKAMVANPDVDILNENVVGEDVTREYTDLQSRLRNQEQKAEQLRKILDEAQKTQDVLDTFDKLSQVTEQIEVLKGQIKFYDESSSLSALNVRLRSQESVAPLTIGGWKPEGTARDAAQALINMLKFIGNGAIWLVIFCLPIGLLLGLPGYFIIRGYLRWRKRHSPELNEAPAEA